MRKDVRRLIKHLRDQGLEVVRGSSHYKVKDHDGRLLAVLGTGSDYRTMRNTVANLRRQGIEMPDRY